MVVAFPLEVPLTSPSSTVIPLPSCVTLTPFSTSHLPPVPRLPISVKVRRLALGYCSLGLGPAVEGVAGKVTVWQ